MGKRSEFERVEKDFYRTIDKRAVEALVPFLPEKAKFAEPCTGAGDLRVDLEKNGLECWWESDIQENPSECVIDALELGNFEFNDCDYIITNPPWSRPILHQMIEHFSYLKPTWLLFDADWAHTRQSAPYMKWCRKIVSVGRLIWIPGTTMSGKDNCAWYLFDQKRAGLTEFYGR